MRGTSPSIESLVAEAIKRMVAEAVRDGGILSAPSCAAEIAATYSRCGLEEADLANEIMMAAAAAGVPVEFGRPLKKN